MIARLPASRVALAWRPDWPVAVVVVLAWLMLIVTHATPLRGAVHTARADPAVPLTLDLAMGGWVLMSLAMMVPATLPAVRHVGLNSIRLRRRRAMVIYTGVYVAVWVAVGLSALALVAAARSTGLENHQLAVVALLIAAGWQLTRSKRRAVVACRRTVPLPPAGWRADIACARFGMQQARRCVVSCWPLMLLMAVVGHGNIVVMAALTAVVVAEERSARSERLIVPVAAALTVSAIGTLVLSMHSAGRT